MRILVAAIALLVIGRLDGGPRFEVLYDGQGGPEFFTWVATQQAERLSSLIPHLSAAERRAGDGFEVVRYSVETGREIERRTYEDAFHVWVSKAGNCAIVHERKDGGLRLRVIDERLNERFALTDAFGLTSSPVGLYLEELHFSMAGAEDKRIRIFGADGSIVGSLEGVWGVPLNRMVGLPGDTIMVIAGSTDEGRYRTYEVNSRGRIQVGDDYGSSVLLAASPDGQTYAEASEGAVHIFTAGRDGERSQTLQVGTEAAPKVAFSPTGRRLIAALVSPGQPIFDLDSAKSSLYLYDLNRDSVERILEVAGICRSLAFTSNGVLAALTGTGMIHLVDVGTADVVTVPRSVSESQSPPDVTILRDLVIVETRGRVLCYRVAKE